MCDHISDKPTWKKKMPVHGQGVFAFNITRGASFRVVIREAATPDHIYLQIGKDVAVFNIVIKGAVKTLAHIQQPGAGYDAGVKISYWFSYDRDRLVLKYGKGYRMEETTILTFHFLAGAKTEAEKKKIREKYHRFFNADEQGLVELYDSPKGPPAKGDLIDIEEPVEFDKNPFICNLSPIVKNSSKVSLFTLDGGQYMLSGDIMAGATRGAGDAHTSRIPDLTFGFCEGSLPPACKELYDNIQSCELNWPQEVTDVLLSDAIRFSIETKGCLLYQKLKDKAGEFGPSSKGETYLRITLGQSIGNSPGIPYVLEIWPSGHFSPIHNHGNANAVIKVLFGSIHISIYNKQTTTPDAKPLKTFDARPGDVTWINRNWYQTHQLRNITDDFCATIQCYNYDAGDTTHWPYFDYVAENSTIDEFLPDSDFGFVEMRDQVMNEYKTKFSPLEPPRTNGKRQGLKNK